MILMVRLLFGFVATILEPDLDLIALQFEALGSEFSLARSHILLPLEHFLEFAYLPL
jgi:hypothetical protein